MPRRRRSTGSLAAQTLALGIAAPQVIAHRMARMASAGVMPSAQDQAEFHRMGAEKLVAAQEAWAAMAKQAFVESQGFATDLMKSLWFPWMQPAPSLGTASRQWNDAAAAILGKGMAPVRRLAEANARRLGRGR